jgi:uncharacterized protein (TIGR02466 family)
VELLLDVMSEIIPLFATPLYKAHIEIPIDVSVACKSEKYYRNTSNNGWMTTKNIHHESDYFPLMKIIDSHVQEYAYNFLEISEETKFSCCGSWINLHANVENKIDWAPEHWHPNSMISGVVYLDAPPGSGGIKFHCNQHRTHLFGSFFDLKFSKKNRFNTYDLTIPVQTGMIVLFPSTLIHSVPPNTRSIKRYSFAFDYIPVGVMDTSLNQLTISTGD